MSQSKKKTKKKTKRTKKAKKPSTQTIKNALGESQNMLKMVINNVPQHIFWKDTKSVFLGCNDNFAKTVGLENPEDIVGKTDFNLTDEEKAKHFIDIDQKVIKEDKPIYGMEEMHKNAEGKMICLDVNKVPLHDADGNVIGILGTFEDVTTKVSLAKKLRNNAQKYLKLIETTNTAYAILDTRLKIVESNNIFADLMGVRSSEDIVGNSLRSWVSNIDVKKFDDTFSRLLDGVAINDLEINIVNEHDSSITVTINANIIENGGKNIFCLIRNVSQRKTEEKKKYIEQQKKKDRIKKNIMDIRGSLRELRTG